MSAKTILNGIIWGCNINGISMEMYNNCIAKKVLFASGVPLKR